MASDEIRLPEQYSYGSSGGPGFQTLITEIDSGAEQRVARWATARRRYDIGYNIKKHADLIDVKRFYMARQGAFRAFRLKDFMDHTSTVDGRASELAGPSPTKDDVEIGIGDASQIQFQLIKKYDFGGPTPQIRTITKPVASSVLIAEDGVLQTEGPDYSVNTATGIITFTVAPAVSVSITAGFLFDVPVRFGEGTDDLLSVNIETFASSGVSVECIEVRDEIAIDDEFFFGGAEDLGALLTNITLSAANARVIRATAAGAIRDIILFDPTTVPAGGPWFYIINESAGSFNLDIQDDAFVSLKVLTPGDFGIAVIAFNGTSNVWVVL